MSKQKTQQQEQQQQQQQPQDAANRAYLDGIARVAHEANRAFYATLGAASQPSWEDASEETRAHVRGAVEAILVADEIPPMPADATVEDRRARAIFVGIVQAHKGGAL